MARTNWHNDIPLIFIKAWDCRYLVTKRITFPIEWVTELNIKHDCVTLSTKCWEIWIDKWCITNACEVVINSRNRNILLIDVNVFFAKYVNKVILKITTYTLLCIAKFLVFCWHQNNISVSNILSLSLSSTIYHKIFQQQKSLFAFGLIIRHILASWMLLD